MATMMNRALATTEIILMVKIRKKTIPVQMPMVRKVMAYRMMGSLILTARIWTNRTRLVRFPLTAMVDDPAGDAF